MNPDQTTEAQLQDYLVNGYRSRRHYLETLCEDFDRETVYALAGLLGPSEDFDGLVTALEDATKTTHPATTPPMPPCSRSAAMRDCIAAIFIGLVLAALALAYFDVLVY